MRAGFPLRWIVRVLVSFVLLACVRVAFADGGRLRFREAAGPFVVTLFTTPDPLTAGRADFSVAVERAGVPGLVRDAQVDLILTPADGRGAPLVLHATHAAATSKWLEAANFSLRARGLWRVAVVVRQGDAVGRCSGEFEVQAPGASNVAWDVLPVPLVALLFLLHQNRKRRFALEHRKRTGGNARAASLAAD